MKAYKYKLMTAIITVCMVATGCYSGNTDEVDISLYRVNDINNIYGTDSVITGDVNIGQFEITEKEYPVFADKYQYDQNGPLFDTGYTYQNDSANEIIKFINILDENHTISIDDVVYDQDISYRSMYTYNDISVTADAESVSVLLENADVSNIQNVYDNTFVMAMIEYCGITNIKICEEVVETANDTVYKYKITNDYNNSYENSIYDCFKYITVEGARNSKYVYIGGFNIDISDVYAEYDIISPTTVINDLTTIYNYDITPQYEVVYLSDTETGHYIPCYKMYVEDKNTDVYNIHYYKMCLVE